METITNSHYLDVDPWLSFNVETGMSWSELFDKEAETSWFEAIDSSLGGNGS